MSASTEQYVSDPNLASLPSVGGTRVRTTGTDTSDSPLSSSSSISPSAQAQAQAQTTADQAIDRTASIAHSTASDLSSKANETSNNLHQRKASASAKINDLAGVAAQQAGKAAAATQELAGKVGEHPLVKQAGENVQQGVSAIDQQLSQYPFLNEIEARTKVPKAYAAIGIVALFGLIITFNIFSLAKPITNLIGWVLPAYMSIGALEQGNLSGDKQWLTYWVVFGFINFLESFALRPVLYYFQYYFLAKLIFTVWLFAPQTRGAEKVYYTAIRPAFRNLQSNIQTSTPVTSSSSKFGTTSSNATSSVFVPETTSANAYGTSTSSTPENTTTVTGLPSNKMGDVSNNPFIGNHTGMAQGGDPGVIGGGSLII